MANEIPYVGEGDWYDEPSFEPKGVVKETDLFRYRLEVKFKIRDKGLPLVVICMNPSKADSNGSDTTVNHLIKHAYHSGYSGLVIFNVHPKYETESEKLFEEIKDVNYSFEKVNYNLHLIEEYLDNNNGSDVLIAWGCGIGKLLGDTIKSIITKLKETNCNISIIDKKGIYPPHPLYAPKSDGGNCFNVLKYNDKDIECYLKTLFK